MLIIGLTGSVGMGKSTVAARFREKGIPVCDADALVHELYEDDAVAPIEAAFPGATSEGKVDRQKLAALLIADPSGFKKLESIVHPLVTAAERECLGAAYRAGAEVAVLEVPLLFETGGDNRCDVTIVVSAPAEHQRERVLQRPGMTQDKLDTILARQLPDGHKRARADFVVDTGQPLDQTLADVDAIIESLKGRRGQAFQRYWA
ncbi:MAG: dephospho-CoA kinase [Hyphomicrobiaceae bacterium]